MRYTISFLLLATLLAGCGGNRGGKQDDTDTKKSPSVKSPEVKPVASGPALPKGFPKEVPIYPGSKVIFAAHVMDAFQVNLTSPDSGDKVVAYYEDQFAKASWAILNRTNMGEITTVVAQKGEHNCGLSINATDAMTTIMMSVARNKDAIIEEKPGKEVPKETPKDKRPTVGGVPLPKGFATDIVLYPMAKVTATVDVPGLQSVSLITSDKAEKVVAYLEADAKKQGWKQFAKTQEENNTVIGLEKTDRVMTITVTQDEGETLIVIGVAKKES